MNNDSTNKQDNRGGADNQALRNNNQGQQWNSPLARRDFLKKTGTAGVGTVLALNGLKLEVACAATGGVVSKPNHIAYHANSVAATLHYTTSPSQIKRDADAAAWQQAHSESCPACPPITGNDFGTSADFDYPSTLHTGDFTPPVTTPSFTDEDKQVSAGVASAASGGGFDVELKWHIYRHVTWK